MENYVGNYTHGALATYLLESQVSVETKLPQRWRLINIRNVEFMGVTANATASFYTSKSNNSAIPTGLNLLTVGFQYASESGLFGLDAILNYTTACVVGTEVLVK